MLFFGKGNKKLHGRVLTFSLPAGYTCPGANECLAKADPLTGKVKDGKNLSFRCFSASQEAAYTSVRISRWRNFNLLKEAKHKDELIYESLKTYKNYDYVRIHVSGDFFSEEYFVSWLNVAKAIPDKIFYFYTKSINIWINYPEIGNGHKPGRVRNFIPTASCGGRFDNLISDYGLRFAKVIFSEDEKVGDIDYDDSHAQRFGPDFSLMIHGTQPKKSLTKLSLGTII
ncbi:MAG: hypothetical protein SNJ64_02885 [Endomicrobiia bacterium]